jgi:flagellar hook-associated protein 1 FlgK
VTGVNIDEEMTNLIASQRAYAAAAKVITTVDQMLDTLIRM